MIYLPNYSGSLDPFNRILEYPIVPKFINAGPYSPPGYTHDPGKILNLSGCVYSNTSNPIWMPALPINGYCTLLIWNRDYKGVVPRLRVSLTATYQAYPNDFARFGTPSNWSIFAWLQPGDTKQYGNRTTNRPYYVRDNSALSTSDWSPSTGAEPNSKQMVPCREVNSIGYGNMFFILTVRACNYLFNKGFY